MKIRWLINVAGTVHGIVDGVKYGDVIDVPDFDGGRYCALHYAEPVDEKKPEKVEAKVEEPPVETAVDPEVNVEKAIAPRPGPKPRS